MAPNYHLDQLRLVLNDPNPQTRQNIRSGLFSIGLRNIEATSTLETAVMASRGGNLDILLIDLSVDNNSASKFVGALRHGNGGENPFSVAIAFAENPSSEMISDAAGAGFDDILIKPFSLAELQKRIGRFMKERKPFVVTSDYIGPDRRKERRPDSQEIPLIIVPNPVRMLAVDGISRDAMQAEIKTAYHEINEQKVERLGFQIVWLADRLVPAFKNGDYNKETYEMAKRLLEVSIDIGKRLMGTRFTHVADLCESTYEVATRLAANTKNPSSTDIDLLANLAKAVKSAFADDEKTANIAREIKSTVDIGAREKV